MAEIPSGRQSKRLEFFADIGLRGDFSNSSDTQYGNLHENIIFETLPSRDKDKPYITLRQRDGISDVGTVGEEGECRGVYAWDLNGVTTILYVVDNHLYRLGNGTPIGTLDTSTGKVGFCEHINGSNVITVFIADGTYGYTLSSSYVLTKITDPDLPTPHIPSPIFMDGYIFLAKSGTADIYNSNLNAPATWTTGSFISAEMYADSLITLIKSRNYILAIGEHSVEYFYDAANATGTPLGRHTSAALSIGTRAPNTVVEVAGDIYFVATFPGTTPSLVKISGFSLEPVTHPIINRILQANLDSIETCHGIIALLAGVPHYLLTINNKTFIYNIVAKLWSVLTIEETSTAFPIFWASSSADGSTYLAPQTFTASILSIQTFSPLNTTDDIYGNYRMAIYTKPMDFGTWYTKFFHRCRILCSLPGTVDGLASVDLQLSWNFEDYSEDQWATTQLQNTGRNVPGTYQLGAGREIEFRIFAVSNEGIQSPLIFYGIELEYSIGAS